jgi:excinuclease ABC subunit C
MQHVGNLAAIREADDATLLAVPGVTPRHVKALRAVFPPTSSQDVRTTLATEVIERQRS